MTDRQTDTQTDTQTHKHTHTLTLTHTENDIHTHTPRAGPAWKIPREAEFATIILHRLKTVTHP